MFEFLRSISLKPIEWNQAIQMTGEAAPFIGSILDAAFRQAQAVVVLLNGDDEARLRPEFHSDKMGEYEKNLTPQARPNVIFEAGLALGRFPKRTIIVEVGELRPFSDIAGRHTIRLDNSVKTRQELAQRLSDAGCSVDLGGTDWHQTGDFEYVKHLELQNDEKNNHVSNQLSQTHVGILEILTKTLSNASGISKRLEMRKHVVLPFLQELLELGFVTKNNEDINIAHFSLEKLGIDYLASINKL
jgi:hypothetical protein